MRIPPGTAAAGYGAALAALAIVASLATPCAFAQAEAIAQEEALASDRSVTPRQAMARQDVPRLAPDEPIPPAELEAFVDGIVASAMAEHRLVGVAVSVVQGGEM